MAAGEASMTAVRRPELRLLRGGADLPDSEPHLDFDGLFRRYAPYVGAIGLRILGREDELEDLVQDVFVRAYRGLSRLKDQARVKAWLARITVRSARRRLIRRRWWRLSIAREPADAERLMDPSATPEERAIVRSVYRMLDELPADDRIVWVLRFVEGEQLEQIAQDCGCSLSTVQRRLRSAKRLMDRVKRDG
jgi:RNA polymerase sigma-70 factor (ECF subfamily)